MPITYHSTRDKTNSYSASEAILKGIAPDGGLFVPETIPTIPFSLEELAEKTYKQLAIQILTPFLSDFSDEEMEECCSVYEERFETDEVAPLVEADGLYFLELFHGPTLAFKDVALSILPKFITIAAKKNILKKDLVVLTATSGDTGSAALAGFSSVPGTRVIVFYPKNGVSPIQEQQMVTQDAPNVHVFSIEGNFDEAQSAVKNAFLDTQLQQELDEAGYQFTSANSINIGRLLPQIVYYFVAYRDLLRTNKIVAGDAIRVAVPTGNFGNVLAAYYAKQMGLPIEAFLVASNKNDVVADFLQTGTYNRNRPFHVTSSPSMDILISSNLERLLYHASGENTEEIISYMDQLTTTGSYSVSDQVKTELRNFHGIAVSEEETANQIQSTLAKSKYLLDPHTAVAASGAKAIPTNLPTVVTATASPFKFPETVLESLGEKNLPNDVNDLLLNVSAEALTPIPARFEEMLMKESLHNETIAVSDIPNIIQRVLLP